MTPAIDAVRAATPEERAAILRELLGERLSVMRQFLYRHDLERIAGNICDGARGMRVALNLLAPPPTP